MFTAFLLLRTRQKRQYAPRTFLESVPEKQRTPELPSGLFNWFGAFWKVPDAHVLQYHSLDGFFFLRFLKIACVIAVVGMAITWPILFPINATGGNGKTQFDILSFGNVKNQYRYFAHALVSWVFYGFVLWMVTRETLFYIALRQAYLLSPVYAPRISQRTVLFTAIPQEVLSEAKLRTIFGDTVKRVWINPDSKELEELVKERDKIAFKLEKAETSLIVTANKNLAKKVKKGEATDEAVANDVDDESSGSIAARYLAEKERPHHKLKPLIGKKVDTINWSRTELETIIPKVDKLQAEHRGADGDLISAAFIEFTTQEAAQAAAQTLTHHTPLHMAPRWVGISPDEVIWSNLRIKWWERALRELAVTTFIVCMIIFWTIPVAFVGVISNINYLTQKVHFLSFIDKIPKPVLGLITGEYSIPPLF
jgi:hypothetical protein